MLWFPLLVLLGTAQAQDEPLPPLPDRVDEWMESVVLMVTGPGWCTGVVIDDEDTVATAYHCIANGLRTEVRLRSGQTFIGRTIAAVPRDDIALLRVDGISKAAPPMAIREDLPRQGERVYGLGHPFAPAAGRTAAMEGVLQWSITEGIISTVGTRLIQTDAALNPGNSGGPVVDERGRIIGITSRKLGGDNIAFLSSVENVRAMVDTPQRPSIMGGQLAIGFASIQALEISGSSGLEIFGQAIVRDRLVATVAFGLGADARNIALERGISWFPAYEFTLALRQRLGRGIWSTAVDLGGGLMGTTGFVSEFDAEGGTWLLQQGLTELAPSVHGRIAMGGIGLRVICLPQGRGTLVEDELQHPARTEGSQSSPAVWLVSLDLDLPGVLATF